MGVSSDLLVRSMSKTPPVLLPSYDIIPLFDINRESYDSGSTINDTLALVANKTVVGCSQRVWDMAGACWLISSL